MTYTVSSGTLNSSILYYTSSSSSIFFLENDDQFAFCCNWLVSSNWFLVWHHWLLHSNKGLTLHRDCSMQLASLCPIAEQWILVGCACFVWHYSWCFCTGDKELEEFLKEEIQMEKKQQKALTGKLPKIKGFEITKTDGPNVTLSKTFENEM